MLSYNTLCKKKVATWNKEKKLLSINYKIKSWRYCGDDVLMMFNWKEDTISSPSGTKKNCASSLNELHIYVNFCTQIREEQLNYAVKENESKNYI